MSEIIPYLFFGLGSICFLVGTILSIINILSQ